MINLQKTIITTIIIVIITNNLWVTWHREAKDMVGSSFPISFIHSFIPTLPCSITSAFPSAADSRIKRKHQCEVRGPQSGPGQSLLHGPPLTHLCHFLLQNSLLWWLKAKRL